MLLYRKSTLAVLLALIFFSFFGTLTASAWMFPKNYDWRYRVISNLLSPRDNPSHYWMAASGLALTGLLMLPFAGYLRRHLGVIAPRTANIGAGTFTAGNFRPRFASAPCSAPPPHLLCVCPPPYPPL